MLAEHIEKDFRHVPSKLVALYNKDLMALKHKEKKLQTELNKAKTQKKTLKDKNAKLNQAKTSASTKKQLAAAKKTMSTLDAHLIQLTNQLDQTKQQTKAFTAKQAKYTFIGKQLLKLEKEFDAKDKKTTKKKTKVSRKTSTNAAPVTNRATQPQEPVTETPDLHSITSNNEVVELDS